VYDAHPVLFSEVILVNKTIIPKNNTHNKVKP
jgi:hypothetical protein